MVSTGSTAGVRTWPNPTGTSIGGNHRSHWAISPAAYAVRDAGSGGRVHRPQLGHPRREHPDRAGPADPLGDHRRRHPRIRLQQLTDPRLDLVDDRTRRRPFIFRRLVRGQRRLHRVLDDPQHPGDRLDRQTLRSMQPTNLCPILH